MSSPVDSNCPSTVSQTYRFSHATDRGSSNWKPYLTTVQKFAQYVSRPKIGKKEEGGCLSTAVFKNNERSKLNSEEVGIIALDSDYGYLLSEIEEAMAGTGWSYIVHSTSSHLKASTEVRNTLYKSWEIRAESEAVARKQPFPRDRDERMKLYLSLKNTMHPRILEQGVQIVREFKRTERRKEKRDGKWVWAEHKTDFIEVKHAPLPRWRLYVFLTKPWTVDPDDTDRRVSLAKYSELYLRIVDRIGLRFDESCRTPDRIMYEVRVKNEAALQAFVSKTVEGTQCDPWALPAAKKRERAARPGGTMVRRGIAGEATEVDAGEATEVDADGEDLGIVVLWRQGEDGDPIDLTEWLDDRGRYFLIADALLERGLVIGDARGDTYDGHVHLICPFESEHSPTAGGHFVRNANEYGGFAATCIHHGCSTRSRLDFIAEFLNLGWLTVADLYDPRFHYQLNEFDELEMEADDEEGGALDSGSASPCSNVVTMGKARQIAPTMRTMEQTKPAFDTEADELDALLSEVDDLDALLGDLNDDAAALPTLDDLDAELAAIAADCDEADKDDAAVDISLYAAQISKKPALLDKEAMQKSLSQLKDTLPTKFEELKELCAKGGVKKQRLNDSAKAGKKCLEREAKPKVTRAAHMKVIRYNEEKLVEHVDEVEEAVVADVGSGVVCSYSDSASTIRIAAPKTVQQLDGSAFPPMPLVYQFSHAGFRERVMRSCAFVIGTGDEKRGIKCPDDIVQTLLSRNGHGMPPLTGIVEAPTPRPDGSLLLNPGYDKATGLYALFDPKILNGFQMSPALKDAQAAYMFLRDEMFKGFPFVSDLDKSIAVAAFLTSLVRRVIDAAPAFAFDAPIYSSGKSALVGVIAQACTGRPAAGTTWPTGEHAEEAVGKKLTSILREGHNLVFFDNVPEGTVLDSATLSAILTLPTYEERILGVTQMLTVPTTVTMIFTGNNIRAGDDMATRLLKSRLDPKEERPDQRTFDRPDLTVWVSENRAKCVQAALAIMLHHAQSGFKVANGLKPSRFKAWDKWVRFSLVTAGAEDPGAGFDASVAGDVKRQALAEVFSQWYAVFGDKSYKAREIVSKINGAVDVAERTAKDTAGKTVLKEDFDEQPGAEGTEGADRSSAPTEAQITQECLENLSEALQELFGSVRGGSLTPKGFSRAMAKFNGREIGGYRLECAVDARAKSQMWRVGKIEK